MALTGSFITRKSAIIFHSGPSSMLYMKCMLCFIYKYIPCYDKCWVSSERLFSALKYDPPLVCWDFHASLSMDFSVAAVHFLGVSSIMNSINMIVTIMNSRAVGDSFSRAPLLIFAALVTSYLLILVAPVLAVGVIINYNIIFKKWHEWKMHWLKLTRA